MTKSDCFDLYQPHQNSRNRDYFYETKRYDSTVAAKATRNTTSGRNFTDGLSSNSYRNSSHGVLETSRNKPLEYTKNVSGKYAHKFTRNENEKAAKARAYSADLPDNGNDPYETYFEGTDEPRSEGRCKSDGGSTTDETEDENNQVSALTAEPLKVHFRRENRRKQRTTNAQARKSFMPATSADIHCDICHEIFQLRNSLHGYIRLDHPKQKGQLRKLKAESESLVTSASTVNSLTANPDL
ncbi:hypothetical protein K3495_g7056 [Podosphaera aphanis]|nr:hypothetical protein K3495_g7056 [Podosphaera aphanis]